MSFGYICKEREKFFFFFFFFLPLFFIPLPIYQKVWFDSRFFFSFLFDTTVTAVAIVYIHTPMTISNIMRLCIETCLTYMKLQDDWTRETM